MAIAARIDYRPETGRLIATVECDVDYNPDCAVDIVNRARDTFRNALAEVSANWSVLAENADDESEQ